MRVTVPNYPYHKATSAYSAVLQLCVRSGQLPTAVGMTEKHQWDDGKCRQGCEATESDHHVFVNCAPFEEWRNKTGEELRKKIAHIIKEAKIDRPTAETILDKAKSFFKDDDELWPLHSLVNRLIK